ncbi:pilus (MSHA type) biogenesis protein MshL [Dissulfurirhabdus thermomarina]|uniref:Pilus (MSHA type) biogenesis protein MshL n=1 Tax=Dissulfurirhabdus thermomarina TaxID=1765737 RepID=A0A6N9TTI3_DISTH|nr:pilus (MSHA type) biogenesis protein MshL [Dissulfurirhabdus thermomarina]NDY42747.1 pilus (MSHA type) biogenesis protein MshL [Dissulfurirhabdus thermomarina]NMX22451.1 pilus (MSHA type) biogenesis protein MshL [Dissulfurirhabdus thermomarina]
MDTRMRVVPEKKVLLVLAAAAGLLALAGCGASGQKAAPPAPAAAGQAAGAAPAEAAPAAWNPQYKIQDVELPNEPVVLKEELPKMKVGADIEARNGTVVLRDLIKGLAELKNMNVSWASDVNQQALVDVDIKAEDDFFTAISNILRQLDYFFEYKGNTIIVKYKETKRYYLPMPFVKANYSSNVGGDLLGAAEGASGVMKGTLQVNHSGDSVDLWATVEQNLDKLLQLAATQAAAPASGTAAAQGQQQGGANAPPPPTQATADRQGFYYTIDKPLGIVTVTAPRSIQEQVANYITNLKTELSRQVVIEARIIEVRLNKEHQEGIDWSELLKNSAFAALVDFGDLGQIYPRQGIKFISDVFLDSKSFGILVDFLDEFGDVRVLSNPKLSLMNGQPAMITVGDSVRYIDKVESNVDPETRIITYTVTTASVLSGLGFSVMANIADNEEVILQITPVTSQLQEPIEYRSFGQVGNENEVGLPRVKLREMTTMARVKNGQLLVIGGLIDDTTGTEVIKVPLLGDIPFIGRYLFTNTRKYDNKRELVILLRPEITQI